MRDIVATIQREQDESDPGPSWRRHPDRGWPGHRQDRGRPAPGGAPALPGPQPVRGRRRALVGPSPIFMSYVDRVLPSLGEETAELRSIGAVVDSVTADRLDPPPLAALKGSLRMRRFLQRALQADPPGVPTQMRIVYGGQVLRLDQARLEKARRDLYPKLQQLPNAGGPEARRALVAALWTVRPENVSWTTRTFASELYERDEFERFAPDLVAAAGPGRCAALAERRGPGPRRRQGLAVRRPVPDAGRILGP